MNRNTLKYLLSLFFLVFVSQLVAQSDEFTVSGQLKDEGTKKKLDDCTVQVFKDGSLFDTFETGTSGRYNFTLPQGSNYDLKFTKPDFSTKIIRIDTRNIPAEDRAGGFEMTVDGTLFKIPEGFNTELLKEPMAKAAFDSQTNSLQFDFEYTDRRLEVIDTELKRLEDLNKNLGKLQAKYDALVKEGDQKMIEKKYGDAVNKFTEALTLIKDKEPAKSKLVEAKKKLDEENAGKEAEAKYQKHIADGDAAFKKKSWVEAKKQFTEASNLKSKEQYPKDKLAQIAEEEKNGAKRADYDKLIADADSKFKNNDYAVSIEKYQEASDMFSNEAYPKDQIMKAQRALDDMLSDEAAKQKREADYQAKILMGEKNFADDKLDMALRSFKEAGNIKPEEELPKKKVIEIEKLIADRKKKADDDGALAAADGERERIEKEYNAHIAKADELFESKKLRDAKTEYEAALAVKSDAQYPKQRIQRIDLLMEDGTAADEKARRKAEEDSLRRARANSLEGSAQDKAALMQQEKEDRERRWAELEEQRIAEQQTLIDSKKNRTWESDADADAEIAVEEFYSNALKTEQHSRYQEVRDKAFSDSLQTVNNLKKQQGLIKSNEAEITAKLQEKTDIEANGSSWNQLHVDETDKKREQDISNKDDYQQRNIIRQERTVAGIAEKQEQQSALSQSDRFRMGKVDDVNDKKEQAFESQTVYTKTGNERIAMNNMKVEETMQKQTDITYAGEETRLNNEQKLKEKTEAALIKEQDTQTASTERIMTTQGQIRKKEETLRSIGEGKDMADMNAKAIKEEREKRELDAIKSDLEEANKRHETRKALLNKEKGSEKDVDLYPVKAGTEELPEGVSENSYELGNKKVTERTVKIGNKVDVYKKIVSKTGIFYFKNERSITQTLWKQETLREN